MAQQEPSSRAIFTPTDRQVRAAEILLAAMTHEQAIQPVVETYQRMILEQHQFKPSLTWDYCPGLPEVVLDPNEDHYLGADDMAIYMAECHAARDALGLIVSSPDHCPLLEARSARIDAENALLATMIDTPRLAPLSKARLLPGDKGKQAIAGLLAVITPFCRREEAKTADIELSTPTSAQTYESTPEP
jgi:hypothetical protein